MGATFSMRTRRGRCQRGEGGDSGCGAVRCGAGMMAARMPPLPSLILSLSPPPPPLPPPPPHLRVDDGHVRDDECPLELAGAGRGRRWQGRVLLDCPPITHSHPSPASHLPRFMPKRFMDEKPWQGGPPMTMPAAPLGGSGGQPEGRPPSLPAAPSYLSDPVRPHSSCRASALMSPLHASAPSAAWFAANPRAMASSNSTPAMARVWPDQPKPFEKPPTPAKRSRMVAAAARGAGTAAAEPGSGGDAEEGAGAAAELCASLLLPPPPTGGRGACVRATSGR